LGSAAVPAAISRPEAGATSSVENTTVIGPTVNGGDKEEQMSRKEGKNIAKAHAAVEKRPYILQDAVPLLQKVKSQNLTRP